KSSPGACSIWPASQVEPADEKVSADVDYHRTQSGSDQDVWCQVRRYGLSRSTGCLALRADQQPDQSLQDPHEGQPFATRAAQARFAAAPDARLLAAYQREPLQGAD